MASPNPDDSSASPTGHNDSANHLLTTTLSTAQHLSAHSHVNRASLHTSGLNPNIGNGYTREPSNTEGNTQDRFELFLLGDGEKKVTEEADTRKLNLSSSSKETYPRELLDYRTNSIVDRSLSYPCLPGLSLHPYAISARRWLPVLTHNASRIQAFPHHRSLLSTRKITPSVT